MKLIEYFKNVIYYKVVNKMKNIKADKAALIGAIIFFIIVIITISAPIHKENIKPAPVEVELHPMVYTWDDGKGDICLPE